MRKNNVIINLEIQNHEVPDLREKVGWARRDTDYPALFEYCVFWAGIRDENNRLIAFGCMVGPGIEHGYLEDVIVHPDYQGKGLGTALVKRLLLEAEARKISIVTVTYDEINRGFYENCGFTSCPGGLWKKEY